MGYRCSCYHARLMQHSFSHRSQRMHLRRGIHDDPRFWSLWTETEMAGYSVHFAALHAYGWSRFFLPWWQLDCVGSYLPALWLLRSPGWPALVLFRRRSFNCCNVCGTGGPLCCSKNVTHGCTALLHCIFLIVWFVSLIEIATDCKVDGIPCVPM